MQAVDHLNFHQVMPTYAWFSDKQQTKMPKIEI